MKITIDAKWYLNNSKMFIETVEKGKKVTNVLFNCGYDVSWVDPESIGDYPFIIIGSDDVSYSNSLKEYEECDFKIIKVDDVLNMVKNEDSKKSYANIGSMAKFRWCSDGSLILDEEPQFAVGNYVECIENGKPYYSYIMEVRENDKKPYRLQNYKWYTADDLKLLLK